MNFAWETHDKDKATISTLKSKKNFDRLNYTGFIDALSGVAQAVKTVLTWNLFPLDGQTRPANSSLQIMNFHFLDVSLRTFDLATISWGKKLGIGLFGANWQFFGALLKHNGLKETIDVFFINYVWFFEFQEGFNFKLHE